MGDWWGVIVAVVAGMVAGASGVWWYVLIVGGVAVSAYLYGAFVLGYLKGYEPEGVAPWVKLVASVIGLAAAVGLTFGWVVLLSGIGILTLAYFGTIVVMYTVDAIEGKKYREAMANLNRDERL